MLIPTIAPRLLSAQLRYGLGRHLASRRGIAGLSMVAAGAMGVVALYQLGLTRRVPEPRLRGLDADKVDASEEAYAKLATPDAFLGLHSYTTTALLAAMGPRDRASRTPWIPLALLAKIAFDCGQAGKLSWSQWSGHRAFCSWCLLAAGSTFAMLPLALPEAAAALRTLRARRG